MKITAENRTKRAKALHIPLLLIIFAAKVHYAIHIPPMSFQVLNLGFDHLERGQWNWQNVSSPFIRIYCVTQGEACVHLPGNRLLRLTPGHLYMIPAGMLHTNECTQSFDHYYLHVYEEADSSISLFDCYDFPLEVEARPLHTELLANLCREFPQAGLSTRDPSLYGHAIELAQQLHKPTTVSPPETVAQQMLLSSSVQLLMGEFLKQARQRRWTHNKRMLKVQEHIHAHLDESLEIGTLAAMACLTPGSFTRLFKQELGLSPLQYINQKRIEQARLLLITQPTMQVQDVAYATGFSEPAYFVRLFHAKTGHTPLQYKKQAFSKPT